ncbi:TetR/AcrR family transcriptional regulator [Hoyosella altamirensis]|uniref:AcrR family transcriptional regulator n=1 Tax=Hoyosella altamirensis TaxID=616997 RepID=A0A839RN94_9ACTN|nr:TetR/AcrR family transcriptional regulator [Hoyosella altamirensis]MBB3038225.1 AcrR family transcriptional regulator [Hoyosella altamirensis]
MSTAKRKYAGDSAGERTLRRRTALLDVALTTMAENRWRTATVDALCRSAKLNKRYFYESFDGLDALADAVIESIAAEVAEAAISGYIPLLDRPVEEQARGAITAVVDILGDDPRKALVLLGGIPATPVTHEKRTAVIASLTAALIAHARTTHDVALEEDSLASTAPAFVIGGSAQAILSWANGDLPITRDQLVDDITALWMALEHSATALARSRLLRPSTEPAT